MVTWQVPGKEDELAAGYFQNEGQKNLPKETLPNHKPCRPASASPVHSHREGERRHTPVLLLSGRGSEGESAGSGISCYCG